MGLFGKILLTLLVIFVAMFYVRTRAQVQPPAVRVVRPGGRGTPKRSSVRMVAYALIVAIVSTTGFFYYRHWIAEREEVIVRVINTRSGATADYRTQRRFVRGRGFQTLDGRKVTVADVERIELLELD